MTVTNLLGVVAVADKQGELAASPVDGILLSPSMEFGAKFAAVTLQTVPSSAKRPYEYMFIECRTLQQKGKDRKARVARMEC